MRRRDLGTHHSRKKSKPKTQVHTSNLGHPRGMWAPTVSGERRLKPVLRAEFCGSCSENIDEVDGGGELVIGVAGSFAEGMGGGEILAKFGANDQVSVKVSEFGFPV
jgi:hypothetical protein